MIKQILKYLAVSLSVCLPVRIYAQQYSESYLPVSNDDRQLVSVDSNYKGYVTNEINDNWFLGLDAGVLTFSGEYYCKGDLRDRIGPIYGLSVGKFFTPSIGLRLQFDHGQIKGPEYPDIEGYNSSIDIFSVHADMLFNISSAVRGYKSSKCWDIIAYWGGGVISSNTTEICLNLGLMNKYKFTKSVSIDFNLSFAALNSTIAKCRLQNKVRIMPALQIGFTYYYDIEGFKKIND